MEPDLDTITIEQIQPEALARLRDFYREQELEAQRQVADWIVRGLGSEGAEIMRRLGWAREKHEYESDLRRSEKLAEWIAIIDAELARRAPPDTVSVPRELVERCQRRLDEMYAGLDGREIDGDQIVADAAQLRAILWGGR